MKKYTSKESLFSEVEFVGGKDAKGRTESWVVTVKEVEWKETDQDHCFYRSEGLPEFQYRVKVQKHKDGKQFGATQHGKLVKSEDEVSALIAKAKQKAQKAA